MQQQRNFRQLHLTKQTTKTPKTSTSQNQDISKKQSGQLQKVEDAYAAATIGPETSVAAIRTKQKNFHPPPLQFPSVPLNYTTQSLYYRKALLTVPATSSCMEKIDATPLLQDRSEG
jgi:hypothetical protein